MTGKYKEALEVVDYVLLAGWSIYDPVVDMEEFLKTAQTALKICHRLETLDVSETMLSKVINPDCPYTAPSKLHTFRAMVNQLMKECEND